MKTIRISWQAAFYLLCVVMGKHEAEVFWRKLKHPASGALSVTSEQLLATGAKLIIQTDWIDDKVTRDDRPCQEFYVSGYAHDGSDVKPYEKYDIENVRRRQIYGTEAQQVKYGYRLPKNVV